MNGMDDMREKTIRHFLLFNFLCKLRSTLPEGWFEKDQFCSTLNEIEGECKWFKDNDTFQTTKPLFLLLFVSVSSAIFGIMPKNYAQKSLH